MRSLFEIIREEKIRNFIDYEKTVWVDGETVIKSDNLNNIENCLEYLNNTIEAFYNRIKMLEINDMKIQFKYDIALNMVKNNCSNYFIDTLKDDSNIDEYLNCFYDSNSKRIEAIKKEGKNNG